MDTRVKALWVEALRSGKYDQGRLQLRVGEGDEGYSYCCLGVLCDVYCKDTGLGGWEDTEFLGETSLLPMDVAEWAEIGQQGHYDHPDRSIEWSLVDDNDGTKEFKALDFKAIADVIEKHF